MKIISGNSNPELADKIAQHCFATLVPANVSAFADGETSVEFLENIRGEDVFIVFDQTAAGGTDAGDNVIMNASDGSSTDDGDDIIGEDEVFLHSGMQRNVLNIFNSGGKLLNSVAGFAPGAI